MDTNELLKVISGAKDTGPLIEHLMDTYCSNVSEEYDTIGEGAGDKRIASGLMSSNTRVHPDSLGMSSYYVDSEFIPDFVSFLKEFEIDDEKSLVESMALFCTQYFGLSKGSNARKKFFQDFEVEVYENTSSDEEYFDALESMKLSMFKQKGAAQCTEYASLTQQCLSLVGIESSLVLGKLECSSDSQESKSEYHAYNIINIEGKKYVIDAANPRIAYNSKGNICGMKTTVINIGETYDKLQEGVSKNISNREEIDGKWTNIDARKLSYTTYLSVIKELNNGLNQLEFND